MKINKNLHFVVPAESDEENVFFHSSPILLETFKRYHFVMAATFNRILAGGLELVGPKIAAMTLEEIARETGRWEGKEGVENGLMEEITRLTNVLCLTEKGWEALPVKIAIEREFVDEMDWQEAKQRIVFFMLVCAMTRAAVMRDLLNMTNDSWQTQTVSQTCTEFAASLPILTPEGTSSKAVKRQSHPS